MKVYLEGLLIFRVYMKGKRHKHCLKLFVLAEPSGLALRIIVYAGATNQDVGEQGHTDLVVHTFLEGKLDIGHSLFMERYYNSVH